LTTPVHASDPTVRTVKFHVGNVMRKLMVSRRAEAVYAATLGLL
jgi:DNA-binding NarL/FixJ family response regulator